MSRAPHSRAEFLRRGMVGSAGVMLLGATASPSIQDASAEPLPVSDLAWARLLLGAELLAVDFYTRAIGSAITPVSVRKNLRRARLNEQEHAESVGEILRGAGLVPAEAADFTFSYPAHSFTSTEGIAHVAAELERVLVGAYLGAIAGTQTASFKLGFAEIAACEAQHLAYFNGLTGAKPFNLSFPPQVPIDQVSKALDPFLS